jgi:hypothetical protein
MTSSDRSRICSAGPVPGAILRRSSAVRSTSCSSARSRARRARASDRGRRRQGRRPQIETAQRRPRIPSPRIETARRRPRPKRQRRSDDRETGPFRRPCGEKCGGATAGAVVSWMCVDVAAAGRATSSSTTGTRLRWADGQRRRTSSCAARHTTSTRRIWTSAALSWTAGARKPRVDPHSPGNAGGRRRLRDARMCRDRPAQRHRGPARREARPSPIHPFAARSTKRS